MIADIMKSSKRLGFTSSKGSLTEIKEQNINDITNNVFGLLHNAVGPFLSVVGSNDIMETLRQTYVRPIGFRQNRNVM